MRRSRCRCKLLRLSCRCFYPRGPHAARRILPTAAVLERRPPASRTHARIPLPARRRERADTQSNMCDPLWWPLDIVTCLCTSKSQYQAATQLDTWTLREDALRFMQRRFVKLSEVERLSAILQPVLQDRSFTSFCSWWHRVHTVFTLSFCFPCLRLILSIMFRKSPLLPLPLSSLLPLSHASPASLASLFNQSPSCLMRVYWCSIQ